MWFCKQNHLLYGTEANLNATKPPTKKHIHGGLAEQRIAKSPEPSHSGLSLHQGFLLFVIMLPAVFHSVEDKNITLTPLSLIDNFGVFDLDPCGLQWHKTANKIISLPDDGLVEEWEGRVWLNPPYSNPKPFIKKLAEHGNGIALVLNSTDTDWFQEYGLKKANGMFLLKGRPKFTRMDMSPVSIMRGVVLFAYREENCQALKNCQLNGYYVGL